MNLYQNRSNLAIHLLGAPGISRDGKAITTLGVKSQAILYYLAQTRQSHLRAKLATLMWGDSPEKNARASLRKALQQLHRTVPDHLVLEGQSIALPANESVWIDAVVFADRVAEAERNGDCDALAEAIQLYRDDFLTGFFVPKAPDFEAWQRTQQIGLREQMLGALQTLSHHWAANENPAKAIAFTRRIVEMEPWREGAHRQMMELLARLGDRKAALAHFEECRVLLQRELAVEPSAGTLKLAARIRADVMSHAQAVRPAPLPSQRRHRPSKSIPANTAIEFPLVGREQEWRSVRELWHHLHQPHFLCIGGESGIGKTRLTEELLVLAEQGGAPVARTRSHALRGQLAYGPITDWLRSAPLQAALTQLEHVWLTEIARLLPELLVDYPVLSPPEPLRESRQRKRLYDALCQVFTAVDGPLLLVLDDLQWTDADTLEWLQYLIESGETQLLVVGTVRSDEIDESHPVHRIRQQLERHNRFTQLPLSPLSATGTAMLAEQVADWNLDDDAAEQLFQDTGGNPLYVIESMRSTPEGAPVAILPSHPAGNSDQGQRLMPAKMYGVIQARLAQLSPLAQNLAQIGATIGRSFDVTLLAKAEGLDEDTVLIGLDELWQRRVIDEVDAVRFDFSHDRIRDVAYAEITPLMRRRLHRNVADAIEAIYGDELDAVCSHLAVHCEAAGQLEQAVLYYQRAAEGAKALFAHQDAVHKRKQALRLLRQLPKNKERFHAEIELLLELYLDQILASGFGSSAAGDALLDAYKLMPNSETSAQHCHVLIQLMKFYRMRGEWFLSQNYTVEAHAVAQQIGDPALMTATRTNFAVVNLHLGNLEQASSFFDQVQPKSSFTTKYGDRVSRYRHCLWLLGFPEQAYRSISAELQHLREIGHRRLAMVLHHDTMLHVLCQNLPEAASLTEELIAVTTERNDRFCLRCANIYRGWLLARQGSVEQGVSLMRRNANEHRDRENGIFECIWRSLLAEGYLLALNLDAALKEIDSTLAHAEQSGDRHWNAQLLKLKGDALWASGAPSREIEHQYQFAIDTARDQTARSLELRATTRLSRLWQKQGRGAEAHKLLSDIYGWFTEGFETHDLVEARTLLDELERDNAVLTNV